MSYGRDRDRISHSFDAGSADLVGVDADDLTCDVEESSAGVAGVDGCIGLDEETG